MASTLDELELAALTLDLPERGLFAGEIGTVVLVHGEHEAYEVEFVRPDVRTPPLETLSADQVRPFRGQPHSACPRVDGSLAALDGDLPGG